MFRVQKCNTHEQELVNRIFISLENKTIPQNTQYIVVNRQWVFALSRISDCPIKSILINSSMRKSMNTRLDRQVTVEPLTRVLSTRGQTKVKLLTYLAMFSMENPEVGPPTLFRKLAVKVLNSLSEFNILDMNESSIEFSISEYWLDIILHRFQTNYNNVKYYIDRLVKVSDEDDSSNNSCLDALDEENQVPALAKLEIEIPLNDKVAGTFADMDYGECVCHVIQPNVARLYEYIKQRILNTVIYDGMSLVVDTRECFGLDTDVAMLFHVRSVPIQSRLGILTPDTVIEFVN
jgi:hypothetical protein